MVTAKCYVGERLELRGKTEKRSICEAMRCVWHGLVVAALVATWVYLTTDQVKMSLERFVVDQFSSTPPPASGPRWVNGKI